MAIPLPCNLSFGLLFYLRKSDDRNVIAVILSCNSCVKRKRNRLQFAKGNRFCDIAFCLKVYICIDIKFIINVLVLFISVIVKKGYLRFLFSCNYIHISVVFAFYCLDSFLFFVHVNLICAKLTSFVSELLGEKPLYDQICMS